MEKATNVWTPMNEIFWIIKNLIVYTNGFWKETMLIQFFFVSLIIKIREFRVWCGKVIVKFYIIITDSQYCDHDEFCFLNMYRSFHLKDDAIIIFQKWRKHVLRQNFKPSSYCTMKHVAQVFLYTKVTSELMSTVTGRDSQAVLGSTQKVHIPTDVRLLAVADH